MALGLLEEALELTAEELVCRLDHGAFPHYCGCLDEVAETNVCLGFAIESLHVLAALLGLVAMVEGLLELTQRKVTGSDVSMDYLLCKKNAYILWIELKSLQVFYQGLFIFFISV